MCGAAGRVEGEPGFWLDIQTFIPVPGAPSGTGQMLTNAFKSFLYPKPVTPYLVSSLYLDAIPGHSAEAHS